jgi:hypothetical protein
MTRAAIFIQLMHTGRMSYPSKLLHLRGRRPSAATNLDLCSRRGLIEPLALNSKALVLLWCCS